AAPIVYFYGLERTTASNSVLLSNSEALFTILFAYAFLGERATPREYLALGGIAVGAFLVTTQLRFGDVQFLGFLIVNRMLLAAFYFFPNETLSGVQVVGGALMVGSLVVFYLFRGPTETRAAGETLKPEASDGPDSP